MPSVGYTFILDPMMRTVAEARADESFDDLPILYHDIATSELMDNSPHVMAAQTSLSVVEQVRTNWKGPDRDDTGLVAPRSVPVDSLKAGNFVWSEAGPGTAASLAPIAV